MSQYTSKVITKGINNLPVPDMSKYTLSGNNIPLSMKESAHAQYIVPHDTNKYRYAQTLYKKLKLKEWILRQKIAKAIRIKNAMRLYQLKPNYRMLLNTSLKNELSTKAFRNDNAIKYDKVGNHSAIWESIYNTFQKMIITKPGKTHLRSDKQDYS